MSSSCSVLSMCNLNLVTAICICKQNGFGMIYTLQSCFSDVLQNGPLRYLSKTIFNGISSEMLRNFYMDNDYRKQWDKTVVEHNQLQVDKSDGTEVGHTIKKFPLLTPREYVLAWKLWQGSDKTFYCFMKVMHRLWFLIKL